MVKGGNGSLTFIGYHITGEEERIFHALPVLQLFLWRNFTTKGNNQGKDFNLSKKEPSNLSFHRNKRPLELYFDTLIYKFENMKETQMVITSKCVSHKFHRTIITKT